MTRNSKPNSDLPEGRTSRFGPATNHGGLYDRNGPNLDPVDLNSIPEICYILPPQPEQAHLFARVPLFTEGLRDRVQELFESAQSITMAPGVSQFFHTQQNSLLLRRD